MSKLHGVDVSGWDKGIDTYALTADFVIVKATEGLQGTVYNPDYKAMADNALKSGKLLGFYHYANGKDAIEEANAFFAAIKSYKGKAVPCLDWEGQGNKLFQSGQDVAWCKKFLDRIAKLMDATPMLYTSKGECNAYDWTSVARVYPLWGAEYAYDDKTYQGYQNDPWQSKARWGAWGSRPLLFQYGYVNPKPNNGGKSSLDGEVFYGTREDWQKLCKVDATPMVDLADVAARIHYDMVTDERNGYTQGDDRWGGNYGGVKTLTINGRKYMYALGDRDCASSVIEAWALALTGTPYEGKLKGATYTGDMLEVFVQSGLFDASLTPAKRGDLYLTPRTPSRIGHVAMCQDGGADGVFGRDCLSEFVRNEYHSAFGGKPGDQDDGESIMRDYYDFPWITVLHYNHKADYPVETPKPAPVPPAPKVKIPKGATGSVYRLYDSRTGDHFLTTSHAEAQSVSDQGSYKYEMIAFVAPADGADVYRLYNTQSCEHMYTTNPVERGALRAAGWRDEGIAWHSGGSVKVYRLYDRDHTTKHIFTKDKAERGSLKANGWVDEGIAFYAKR